MGLLLLVWQADTVNGSIFIVHGRQALNKITLHGLHPNGHLSEVKAARALVHFGLLLLFVSLRLLILGQGGQVRAFRT